MHIYNVFICTHRHTYIQIQKDTHIHIYQVLITDTGILIFFCLHKKQEF